MKFNTDGKFVASASGRERILFVDDEELFGYMGSRMLERQGYRVTYIKNSAEALEHFSFQPTEFDLVITGQTLSPMTGAQLSHELLKIRPEIPIMLCTASANITEEETKLRGIREFMPKPLDSNTFARKIRKILNEKTGQ
jgi:DNA-binding NtrC family response regulator